MNLTVEKIEQWTITDFLGELVGWEVSLPDGTVWVKLLHEAPCILPDRVTANEYITTTINTFLDNKYMRVPFTTMQEWEAEGQKAFAIGDVVYHKYCVHKFVELLRA